MPTNTFVVQNNDTEKDLVATSLDEADSQSLLVDDCQQIQPESSEYKSFIPYFVIITFNIQKIKLKLTGA